MSGLSGGRKSSGDFPRPSGEARAKMYIDDREARVKAYNAKKSQKPRHTVTPKVSSRRSPGGKFAQ